MAVKNLRLAVTVAFLGLTLASLLWSASAFRDPGDCDNDNYETHGCDYWQNVRYHTAMNDDARATWAFAIREVLLITGAIVAWVLAPGFVKKTRPVAEE